MAYSFYGQKPDNSRNHTQKLHGDQKERKENSVGEGVDVLYYEKRLRARLEEIRAAMETRKEGASPVELDQSRVGRVSRMDAMQQQAMAKAAERLAAAEKIRIQKALDRIQSGEYGYCTHCDEEIAEKRLDFDPSVMFCIECARAAEQK